MINIDKDKLQMQLPKWEEMKNSNAHGLRLMSICLFFRDELIRRQADGADSDFYRNEFEDIGAVVEALNVRNDARRSEGPAAEYMMRSARIKLETTIEACYGLEVLKAVRP